MPSPKKFATFWCPCDFTEVTHARHTTTERDWANARPTVLLPVLLVPGTGTSMSFAHLITQWWMTHDQTSLNSAASTGTSMSFAHLITQWRMTHDMSRYRISRKCIWWTMNDEHSSNKGNTNVRATVDYWPLMTRSNGNFLLLDGRGVQINYWVRSTKFQWTEDATTGNTTN